MILYSYYTVLYDRDIHESVRYMRCVFKRCIVIAASHIRGMVVSVPFDQFHKYSTDIVRTAVLINAQCTTGCTNVQIC